MVEKECELTDVLSSLPEEAISQILNMLEPRDLAHLCQASSFVRTYVGENNSIAVEALEQEELPGENVDDLIQHYDKWRSYQQLLLESLFQLFGGKVSLESEDRKQACRKFLRSAIHQFTIRVAGAHSWYKHLPIGKGVRFSFYLNLAVNMHRTGEGQLIKKEEGDGTEFHYTWLPTDRYRERYGFFDFGVHSPTEAERHRVLYDFEGNQYNTPLSMMGPFVHVTAAVHNRSTYLNLYKLALDEAIQRRQPEILLENLQMSMLNRYPLQFEYRRLPEEAAKDLQRIAATALLHSWNTTDIDEAAEKSIMVQRIREQKAIAMSLRELCLRNFGGELTPSIEEAVSFLPSR